MSVYFFLGKIKPALYFLSLLSSIVSLIYYCAVGTYILLCVYSLDSVLLELVLGSEIKTTIRTKSIWAHRYDIWDIQVVCTYLSKPAFWKDFLNSIMIQVPRVIIRHINHSAQTILHMDPDREWIWLFLAASWAKNYNLVTFRTSRFTRGQKRMFMLTMQK